MCYRPLRKQDAKPGRLFQNDPNKVPGHGRLLSKKPHTQRVKWASNEGGGESFSKKRSLEFGRKVTADGCKRRRYFDTESNRRHFWTLTRT
jgi:hypothetical protein